MVGLETAGSKWPLSTPIPQTFGGPRYDGVSNPPTSSGPLAPWSHLLEPVHIAVTRLVFLTTQTPGWDKWGAWDQNKASWYCDKISSVYIYDTVQAISESRAWKDSSLAQSYKNHKIGMHTHINDSSFDLSFKHKYREANTHLSDSSSMGPIASILQCTFFTRPLLGDVTVTDKGLRLVSGMGYLLVP